MTEIRDIVERVWTRIVEFDVERSFTCGPGREVSAEAVVMGAGWSLFTYDFKRNAAVFLRTPDGLDFSQAPFVYNTQFQEAVQVALVGFDELLTITESLPDIAHLVQFFSTGHCGSTLLHNVFNRVPSVWCVSEPITFNALALNGQNCDPLVKLKLVRGALRLLAQFPGAQSAERIIIKHFSQSTTQIKLLSDAQPQSKLLFLYRDAEGWANSAYHFVQKYGTSMNVAKDQRTLIWRLLSGGMPEQFLDGIIDLHAEDLKFDAVAAVAWATQIQNFNLAFQQNVPLYAFRYNELVADREDTIGRLFDHLNLNHSLVAATLSVFEKNAHEGTRSARSEDDLHFDDQNYAVVRKILTHPRIAIDPHVVLQSA